MGPNIRKSYTGQIKLGPVEIDVVAKNATGSDPREVGFQRLCSCCNEPYHQSLKCGKGKSPKTAAAEKRGDKNLSDVVYGVLAADDTYVVIADDVIEDIEEMSALPYIEINEVVPPATADAPGGFPFHAAIGTYYLAYDKDGDDQAAYFVAAFHTALRESGNVAVARWTQRGPQKLVGIHAVGDALMMTVVPFGAQMREPDALCLHHTSVKVDDADEAAVEGFLDGMTSATFDHDSYEDDSIAAKAEATEKAMAAARKGRKVKIAKTAAAKPTRAKGSLAGMLGAPTKASKPRKPAAKRTAKAKA